MRWIIALCLGVASCASCAVRVGLEVFLDQQLVREWRGKNVALLTHAAAVDSQMRTSFARFHDPRHGLHLMALFSPEHGLSGSSYAEKGVEDTSWKGIPLYSLYGVRRRPTPAMFSQIHTLFVDLQDIGLRWYTYASTLFYCMEVAAECGVEVVVLDRPNPLGGLVLDGPMLEESWRSFVGYLNIPICHGMTIGELARFFQGEYRIPVSLKVIPMEGWSRRMTFAATGRPWVPPSPNIPEPDTPMYNAMTGALGELGIVNVGVGYTLPFKVMGAPWIDAERWTERVRHLQLPGLLVRPLHYTPHYGLYAGKECHGCQLFVTDWKVMRPLQVGMALLSLLRELYPKEITEALQNMSKSKREMFNKVLGTAAVWQALQDPPSPLSSLLSLHQDRRRTFSSVRKPYLLPQYP